MYNSDLLYCTVYHPANSRLIAKIFKELELERRLGRTSGQTDRRWKNAMTDDNTSRADGGRGVIIKCFIRIFVSTTNFNLKLPPVYKKVVQSCLAQSKFGDCRWTSGSEDVCIHSSKGDKLHNDRRTKQSDSPPSSWIFGLQLTSPSPSQTHVDHRNPG